MSDNDLENGSQFRVNDPQWFKYCYGKAHVLVPSRRGRQKMLCGGYVACESEWTHTTLEAEQARNNMQDVCKHCLHLTGGR